LGGAFYISGESSDSADDAGLGIGGATSIDAVREFGALD
jgi:hypothetical protein